MDTQTFNDLEIFKGTGRQSIFARMDFTLTAKGSACLKHRFLDPTFRLEAIKNTQEVISYFIRNAAAWEKQFTRNELSYLEHYLQSNITPLIYKNKLQASYAGTWYKLRYTSDHYFLETCIRRLVAFIAKLGSIVSVASPADTPPLPARIRSQLQSFYAKDSGDLLGKDLTRRSLKAWEFYYLDDFFRRKNRRALEELFELFYEMDAILSMATATQKYNLRTPTFDPEASTVHIRGLYHLFLPESERNDLRLEEGKHFIFLTGSNMSGKSTYLKACGIAVYLAHIGMGIPAESAVLPVFNDIFTNIYLTDDIEKGYSYFFSEVNRIRELAEELSQGKKIFVLIDEMFRGTNLMDALDCSRIVIEKLLLWKNSTFILSSHFTEIADLFIDQPALQFSYFQSYVEDGKPHFTYHLKNGISHERLGKLILLESRVQELLSPH
ncbi:MAG TPA: hypothetical protein VFX43_19570 [Chitinophagaceae bacterium]|nr:hypothetical protein [Chitinophagaceae bacterium]